MQYALCFKVRQMRLVFALEVSKMKPTCADFYPGTPCSIVPLNTQQSRARVFVRTPHPRENPNCQPKVCLYDSCMIESKRHKYGFTWGPVDVCCAIQDERKGWVMLLLRTKRYPNGIQVYVTPTGKVRIHSGGEWKPEKPE